jgi:hypothetical protein
VPTVSKEVKATTTQIASERLKRLRHQNAKLLLDIRKIKGQVGDLDKIRREVLAANAIVKQQVLAVPVREAPMLGLTREQTAALLQALTVCLNDLAFQREEK